MTMKSYFRLSALFAALVFVLPLSTASAGGYDTPMLYSARHMGMGGTAVASANDPSAIFHNPAGLMGTERLTLMANFSPLIGTISGNPAANDQNATSDVTFAPFFLAGVSARLTENIAIGFAAYPVASAGATYGYEHTTPAGEMASRTDSTTLFFFELSPGISFKLPDIPITIGFGYRMTYVSLDRERDASNSFDVFNNSGVDFSLSGWSFAGLRFGIQYQMFERFSLGLSYRHRTTTEIEGSGSLTLGAGEPSPSDLTGEFTLPSRLSFGFRMNLDSFSFAADAEYGFQSQNPDSAIEGFLLPITQVSRWQGAWTVRLGAEYRIMNGRLPIRAGFIWDQRTSNPAYPSAFGTPPAPTYIGTLGAGFDMGSWQANLSGAFRYGSTTITTDDIAGRESCSSCSQAGDASISLGGIYLDFSYHFGRGAPEETRAGITYGDADPLFGSDEDEAEGEIGDAVSYDESSVAAEPGEAAEGIEADVAASEAGEAAVEAELEDDAEARARLQEQAAEAQAQTAAAAAATDAAAAVAAEEAAEAAGE